MIECITTVRYSILIHLRVVHNGNDDFILDECGNESMRKRTVLCANEATMEIVADYLCGDQRAKPENQQACEGKPCKV